ncbi:MAG: helix-turn-helix domain-containing protein [Candidatus Jettenia caeni]|nr:MAG: helix-turn-helix domain-containing protein [Candidatus Jettenia caeni]
MKEMKEKEDDVLWTIKDVARYFRLSIKMVYIKVSKREIPSVKIGRNLRFKPSRIKDLIEQQ